MTFEDLVQQIEERGMSCDGLTQEQVLDIGKTLKLERPKMPLKVEVVEYTGKNKVTAHYVKTSNFPLPAGAPAPKTENPTARGLFVRVEVLDEAIDALQQAKAMLSAASTDGQG